MNRRSSNGVLNMLTFDIEEWFHANYENIDPAAYRGKGSNFRNQMDTLLQMLHDTGCKATFFVLGSIGEDYPDVVRAIASQGHEVASHGYGHQLAYRQSRDEFRADVQHSLAILEDVLGMPVLGYRAPSWSLVESNLHYLEVLEELGLNYDASIFPVKTFLYGIPDAPTEIHHPVIQGRELTLYEVPMSIFSCCGKNIGYSGGFYFRFFPTWFIKQVIASSNRQGKSSIVYLHPRELDAAEQRLSLPRKEAFIQYHNVGRTKDKLHSVLTAFRFTSITDFLRLTDA